MAARTIESIIDDLEIQDDGCYVWTKARTNGYGTVHYAGRQHKAHRLLYEQIVEPVPEGLELDHLCRNRACCNPDHLEPVLPLVNRLRGYHPNRDKTVCKNGHPLAVDNVAITTEGRRRCKECRKQYGREWFRKNYATTGEWRV